MQLLLLMLMLMMLMLMLLPLLVRCCCCLAQKPQRHRSYFRTLLRLSLCDAPVLAAVLASGMLKLHCYSVDNNAAVVHIGAFLVDYYEMYEFCFFSRCMPITVGSGILHEAVVR